MPETLTAHANPRKGSGALRVVPAVEVEVVNKMPQFPVYRNGYFTPNVSFAMVASCMKLVPS
jgi:hypothetical protein